MAILGFLELFKGEYPKELETSVPPVKVETEKYEKEVDVSYYELQFTDVTGNKYNYGYAPKAGGYDYKKLEIMQTGMTVRNMTVDARDALGKQGILSLAHVVFMEEIFVYCRKELMTFTRPKGNKDA